VAGNVAWRGAKFGVEVSRRHLGLLGPLRDALRDPLCAAATPEATYAVLDCAEAEASGDGPGAPVLAVDHAAAPR
jgi:hypothetical protein